jgi:uncharacterized protein (TIGR02679 family)
MALKSDRLHETLGRPELSRLLQRLRKRLEQGKSLTGAITLEKLTTAEQDAFSRLLGRMPAQGHRLSVDLDLLGQRLIEAGLCESLDQAVQHLVGPVTNHVEARHYQASQWQKLFDSAFAHLPPRPEFTVWLERIQSQGLLRRYGLEPARVLLAQSLLLAARLPADGILLAKLAADTVGDAHALDLGRPLGNLVIRLAAPLAGITRWDNAAARREAWEAMGVLLDDLSAPVLTLNLRSSGAAAINQMLNTWADIGEPCHLTLRQLRRTPPGFSIDVTGSRVFVCENPNIIATAAERLGRNSVPLICTEGHPRTSLHELLRQLTSVGIQLRYHGDFDWPGIQMANAMIVKHGAAPWQMSVADYLQAATFDFPLSGTPIAAIWEPQLQSTMQTTGRAVHEEQVVDRLLCDLHA